MLPTKVFGADTDLDYASFVDTGDAHILEKLIINFALPRVLDHDGLAAVNQRPECGRLGLLVRIRAKSEGNFSIGEVGAPLGIGDPELLLGRSFRDVFQDRVDLARCHTDSFSEGDELCGKQGLADHMASNSVLAVAAFNVEVPGHSM